MAINVQMNLMNSSGSYDVLWPEYGSGIFYYQEGTYQGNGRSYIDIILEEAITNLIIFTIRNKEYSYSNVKGIKNHIGYRQSSSVFWEPSANYMDCTYFIGSSKVNSYSGGLSQAYYSSGSYNEFSVYLYNSTILRFSQNWVTETQTNIINDSSYQYDYSVFGVKI